MKRCTVWISALAIACALTIVAGADAQAGENSYIGAKKCMKCHFKEYSAWKKMPKAKSFDSISGEADKELCYPCHTTGYGKPGGFKSKEATPHLLGAQCESCHGPGAKHAELGKAAKAAGGDPPPEVKAAITLTSAECSSCHNPHVKDTAAQARKKEPKAERVAYTPTKGNTYVGSKKCMKCHFKEYSAWKKMPKAKAFDVIADEPDKELCYPCHATGWGDPNGFKSKEATPHLVGVQCEGCHGPGGKHIELGTAAKAAGGDPPPAVKAAIELASTNCVNCHNPHVKDTAAAARKKK
ncbi:MAG: hypothetical protein HQ592_15570 [Planctomycetes bacterium]|nr:hypothetical protein [Planctomycetota bacterium]